MPHLILLNGLPASGKTTFGRMLSKQLGIPLISKDRFKEALGDSLKNTDAELSKLYGRAAYTLLLQTVDTILSSGGSCIVDSIFRQEDEQVFSEFVKRYQVRPLQIRFICEGEVLFQRFVQRFDLGERHRVHLEHYLGTEFMRETLMRGKNYELLFTPVFLQIDTTDIGSVDWECYAEKVKLECKGAT